MINIIRSSPKIRLRALLIMATPGATSAVNVVNSPLQTLSNAATDVITGQCRDLCYAVNAVYALQELYGGSLRMQLGGQARVVEEEKGGKSLDAWDNLGGE